VTWRESSTPKGVTVNSQECKPLEMQEHRELSPNGASVPASIPNVLLVPFEVVFAKKLPARSGRKAVGVVSSRSDFYPLHTPGPGACTPLAIC